MRAVVEPLGGWVSGWVGATRAVSGIVVSGHEPTEVLECIACRGGLELAAVIPTRAGFWRKMDGMVAMEG